MDDYRDIVIAGGGMVGISLALRLGNLMPAACSIALVEGVALPEPGAREGFHPSFDGRSTALSYSSRQIYETTGIWNDLEPWLCPIRTIHVSSRGRFGSALLDAAEHGWPALGYVAENAWLGRALSDALYRQGRVELMNPARVVAAEPRGSGMRLQLEGTRQPVLDAGLLVVADGANSTLREGLGVAQTSRSYQQCALIANVATSVGHGGRAFERFTEEGPLALLPLTATGSVRHRSALVWTLPPARARELERCGQADFLDELQHRFGYRLGRLLQAGTRQTYPLSLVQSAEQVRQGVVVIGNAAHALHPVAGQGFNLALRDVDALAAALAGGAAAGRPVGDLRLLQSYRERQREDQARTIGFSDRVPGLFTIGDPLFGVGRDLALAGLDILPGLKREFVRQAAGVAARRGRRGG